MTRFLIRTKLLVKSMGGFFSDQDWTRIMHAQERKDFRRVQKSRDTWKERAVSRGENHRRIRERHKEVERSREAWRHRALAAESRAEQLEIENQQLKRALEQAAQPTEVDNQLFF